MIITDPDFDQHVPFHWHLGACYKSGITGLCYVHIPKNASSFVRDKLVNKEFVLTNYQTENISEHKFIAILRDPVDRWISGVLEYLTRAFTNPIEIVNDPAFSFDRFEFDEHTARQTKFLHGLSANNITFFYCDRTLKNNLYNFFKDLYNIVLDPRPSWQNKSSESSIKQQLRPLVISKIDQESLANYLQPEYKLIESVKFYGRS